MITDDVIDRLGRDLTVVTPLPAPERQTAVWLVWATIYLGAIGVTMFARTSLGGVMSTPLYLVQQAAAMVTGIAAARAAFQSVIPGENNRAWVPPAIGAAVWAASLFWEGMLDLRSSGLLGLTSQTDWPCVASMTIGGVVVGLPLAWMLRRGAPLTPRGTAFLGGLAALSVANIEACVTRPHEFAMTVLLWHGGTVAVVATLSAMMGRRWLRWATVTTLGVA